MRNPWLAIPLSDYEDHMESPGVAQAQMLTQILADVLDKYTPGSIAVLGCAGGKGFTSISPSVTKRVVGIDLNHLYVAKARTRYEGRFSSLELHVADIQRDAVDVKPVDLVFAALILEYVDVEIAIARTRSMLGTEGKLVTVVQLPSTASAKVTPSPYASLQALANAMQLVPPDKLSDVARSRGYLQIESRIVVSAGGKQFQVQVFMVTDLTPGS